MKDFNVKVTNWIENKEAQELFFNLGASWCYGKQINENIPSDRDIILHNFGSQLFWAHTYETENYSESEEITLQELRDMVKPKMKEYLFKYNDQYTLVELSKEDVESNPEQYIEVPEKYDAFIELNSGEKVFYKWHTNGHCLVDGSRLNLLEDFVPKVKHILWKRNNNITGISDMSVQESINDKIATAEVARQQSKNIDATLAERQSQYGSFEDVAFVTENIMATLEKVRSNGLQDLPHTHRMALYMIASKMARIVNGDFNHLDGWHDIGGYSKLIEDLITLDQ